MNIKNNIRFQENEKKIKDCVLELLEHKNITEITVQSICKTVGINRSTFYAHYIDIYDLIDKIEKEMHEKIISNYKEFNDISQDILNGDFFLPFLKCIRENKNFYKACLKSRNTFPIDTGYSNLMEHVVVPACKKSGITDENEMIYYLVFYQAGFTFVLKRWVEKGCTESPEAIANYLKHCMTFTNDNSTDIFK